MNQNTVGQFQVEEQSIQAEAQSTKNASLAPLSKQCTRNGYRSRHLTRLWLTAHPVSTVEVTACSAFSIDVAKKGPLSPDTRTHWHYVFCLYHNDLDYSILDAPCENICLSFQSPNSEASLHPGSSSLVWGLVRWTWSILAWSDGQAATAWPPEGLLLQLACLLQLRTATDGWPTAKTHTFCNKWLSCGFS